MNVLSTLRRNYLRHSCGHVLISVHSRPDNCGQSLGLRIILAHIRTKHGAGWTTTELLILPTLVRVPGEPAHSLGNETYR